MFRRLTAENLTQDHEFSAVKTARSSLPHPIPAGTMLHRRHGLTASVFRLTGGLTAHELLARCRILVLGKLLKVFFADLAGKPTDAPARRT
jgi:hypothetical protein